MHASRDAATILHADLDSFFASVEQRDDESLRGRPVAVGGGVVLAASYEAKAYGVRSAMNGRQARELCPGLVTVSPRFEAYTTASKAVFEVFDQTTPFVEGISIDEAFLDVAGLRRAAGRPVDIARELRRRVRDEVGLPITVGVARTKFLAKVASAVGKPDGLLVVPPERETDFLHPLPVERLWGVGPKTSAKLHARGISTVGELAALGPHVLSSMLGPASGHHLDALSHNRDPRSVDTGRRRRSIGAQRSLAGRPASDGDLDASLIGLVERVAGRMRKANRVGRTVVLRLRFDDFTRATRSHTLPEATNATASLLAPLRALVAETEPVIRARGLTLVGISVTNLDGDAAVQLELPLRGRARSPLEVAIDDVRDRYGSASVTRAVLLGRAPDLEMPLLPD